VLTLPLAPARRASAPAALEWSRRNPRVALPLAGTAAVGVMAALWLPHDRPVFPTKPASALTRRDRVQDRPLHGPQSVAPARAGWALSASAACRLRLPASWRLVASSRHHGPGWAVVARPPGTLASVRCAVAPVTAGDPYRLALRAQAIAARDTGFRLLRFQARTIHGRPAYEIEYRNRMHGVLIRHWKIFVQGRALLEAKAPAARFGTFASTFEGIFESYAGRGAPVSRLPKPRLTRPQP
jgi:hypothetical protein